jgi:hypothetical protein
MQAKDKVFFIIIATAIYWLARNLHKRHLLATEVIMLQRIALWLLNASRFHNFGENA